MGSGGSMADATADTAKVMMKHETDRKKRKIRSVA